MYRSYTSKNGEKLKCWYNDLGCIEILNPETHKEIAHYEFDRKLENPTFTHNGETFNINDFDYLTVDELIEKIKEANEKKDRFMVGEDVILATFLKQTDKIGVIGEADCYSTIIPLMGIALKGSDSQKVKTVLVPFDGRYPKKDWHYKIGLTPSNQRVRELTGAEHYYFSDFCSMLFYCFDRPPRFEIVNLDNVDKDYCEVVK